MHKVLIYSLLLVLGLVLSQVLPHLVGPAYAHAAHVVKVLTMVALAFIMIHVGFEFDIDKGSLKQYGWDYVVAFTAASFPWIFCTAYFLIAFQPAGAWTSWDAWKETLLVGRFAAPTSAGVLFSMLAAAGLAATWVYRKTRVLAIFDDLDTVLLMIPLKMMIVGLAWQLGLIIVLMAGLLWLAWRYLHAWQIPSTWPWVLGYAAAIAGVSEVIYLSSKLVDEVVPIHFEVLLPAFVLGCMMARTPGHGPAAGEDCEHFADPREQRAATVISSVFMVLVGLSMPALLGGGGDGAGGGGARLGWGTVILHVLGITLVANLGKMFPALCYRREAGWRQRLAVAIAMWPRGEVGAGVLIVSLSYGLGGDMVLVAMGSLALNLLLTGVFIMVVRRLIQAELGTDRHATATA